MSNSKEQDELWIIKTHKDSNFGSDLLMSKISKCAVKCILKGVVC